MDPATIIIDGECGLCRSASHYGMRHARPGMLRFVASQSPEGRALLAPLSLQTVAHQTMVALEGPRARLASSAVVEVAKRLRWPYRAGAALWLVPKPLRDALYQWVSRRRRRIPG